MRVGSAAIVLFVASSLILAAGAGTALATSHEEGTLREPTEPILVYNISISGEGDATWNVTVRFPTGTAAESDAFEEVATAYAGDEATELLPVEPFEVTADVVDDEVDRDMAIQDVEREVIRMNDVGMISLTFEWTGFAKADGDRVIVGDVFVATKQPWFATLNENEYLRISGPNDYTVESSGMAVRDGTMWMDGPRNLNEEQLSGTFVASSPPPDPGNDGRMAAILGGAGVTALLLGVLLAIAYAGGWPPLVAAITRLSAEERTDADGEADSDAAGGDEEPDPLADRELLSDEELVLRLVEHHGGRMKQGSIVEESDWSNAKVSQLLSQMSEQGEIRKLRIGRENLISLPDEQSNGQ